MNRPTARLLAILYYVWSLIRGRPPKYETQFWEARLIEKFSARVSLWWGFLILTAPHSFFQTPRFKAFALLPVSELAWGLMFAGVGAAHLIVLWANGRWPRGPHLRVCFSTFGVFAFGLLGMALAMPLLSASSAIDFWERLAPAGPGFGVYMLLAYSNLESIRVASRDVRYAAKADHEKKMMALGQGCDIAVSGAVANDASA